MAFRSGSLWSERNELRCLALMKKLHEEGSPAGRQAEYSRALAASTGLSVRSVNAKIGNFKSLAGLIGPSNWSQNSKAAWEKYGHLPAAEIQALTR
ncbi:MAG: hypothetical protein RBS17_04955 [Coriobacteriia bacterium]|nr:hypothetical protein [Coriobacteriia bacterium]